MHCIQRGMLWWFTEGKQCTVSREGCCGGLLKESNASFCPLAISREGCCGPAAFVSHPPSHCLRRVVWVSVQEMGDCFLFVPHEESC